MGRGIERLCEVVVMEVLLCMSEVLKRVLMSFCGCVCVLACVFHGSSCLQSCRSKGEDEDDGMMSVWKRFLIDAWANLNVFMKTCLFLEFHMYFSKMSLFFGKLHARTLELNIFCIFFEVLGFSLEAFIENGQPRHLDLTKEFKG